MNISILGYNLNLEVLILIGVIYLILVGHTFCGCCNFKMMEGMETSTTDTSQLPTQTTSEGAPPIPTPSVPSTSGPVAKKDKKEGFTGANINYGQSSMFDLNNNTPINTSSWSAQNMTVVPGQPLSQGVKDFLARPKQQLPLPEGQLSFFANTPFKPECCPNTYSNSSGCACMTGEQYNYLILRSMNNVPYSEF